LKRFHDDVNQVVHADHALHSVAAAYLPYGDIPSVVAQRDSAEASVSVKNTRMSVSVGPSSPRRNRPRVAQHFVQLARQWVARIESLQLKLGPLQHELAAYDQSIALVKKHLAEAESQRDAVSAVIQSSSHSVDAAKRLLENSHAERLALEQELVHVANQISAASGTLFPAMYLRALCILMLPPLSSSAASFQADKVAAADAALKYSLAQERVNPTPEDELAKQIAASPAPSTLSSAPVPLSHAHDLAVINSAIDSREVKHSTLDEYGEQPDDQPFRSSWQPMK